MNAAVRDAPTLLFKEEYVTDMVQLEKGVVVKDVLARQLKEGYVLGMVQKSEDASMKDASN